MGFIETVNERPFDIELMKRMLDHLDDMDNEQRGDMTGRGLGLIRFLDDQGIGGAGMERAHTLIAFEFRMEALARLRDRPEYRAWTLQLGNKAGDPDLINEVLVETAATQPIVEIDERPAFEPESFFRAALERSEVEGRA